VCIVVVVLCLLLLVFLCELIVSFLVCIVVSCLLFIVVVLCVFLSSYVYLFYYVCVVVFTLDAGLLARSQYWEGPATGNLDTSFSRFPCVYKQMLTDGSQHSKLPLHASHVALRT